MEALAKTSHHTHSKVVREPVEDEGSKLMMHRSYTPMHMPGPPLMMLACPVPVPPHME